MIENIEPILVVTFDDSDVTVWGSMSRVISFRSSSVLSLFGFRMCKPSLSLISWCAGQVWGLCVWWFVVCRSLSLIWRVARVVPPAGGLGHCSGCEAFLRCAPFGVCGRNFKASGWRRLGELVQSEVVHQEQEQDQVGKPGKGWWVPPSGSQLGGHVQQAQWRRWAHWARHARRCCCTPVAGNRWRRWVAAPTCHYLGGTNLPPPCTHPANTLWVAPTCHHLVVERTCHHLARLSTMGSS